MWLPILIGLLSVGLAILGVYLTSKRDEKEVVPPPPPPPPPPVDEEPDPPADGDLPAPIDWESLSCDEIGQKIEDIKNLLMVSKWSDPRIYPFWVEQLEIGEKLWVSKCSHPLDYPPASS